MSTGGGWQDQVGGITPGLKYITSMPGIDQQLKVTHVEIPEEAKKELDDRFVLIYTGQRRLARNLLRDVVGRYDIRPYITESGEVIKEHSMEPLQLIAQELEKAGIVPYIRLNQPFCRYNPTFLKQFLDSKRVMATCAVKKQQGIFVDPDLNIILCNELRHIIMGGYQRDFWDYKSMLDVYNKQDTVRLYNKLEGCPMKKCVKCDMWEKCGGSCILHWL